MKKLDRYILKEFMAPLGLVVLGLAGLVLLVQVVDTLPRMREWGASAHLILLHHLANLPYLVSQVLPLGVMLASLISLGALARSSELAAARAGGISSFRVALPILWAALAASVLLFAASELLIPKASYYSRYIHKVLIEKRDIYFDVPWRNNMAKSLSGGRQLYCREFDSGQALMRDVILVTRRGGGMASRVDAKRLSWDAASGWTLHEGVERVFNAAGDEEAVRAFRQWPVDIKEKPRDFMVDADKREQDLIQLSIKELSALIEVLKKTGADYRKELICLHLRISYPFSCFILALLGVSLPFLFPHGRRAMTGATLGVLVSLGTGMLYLVFIQVGLSLGKAGTLPIIPAAWLGNAVFFVLGSVTLWKVNR